MLHNYAPELNESTHIIYLYSQYECVSVYVRVCDCVPQFVLCENYN